MASPPLRRVVVAIAGALTVYLAGGHLLHRVVMPLPAPDPATFPVAGDTLASRAEGFRQTILEARDGWVRSRLVVTPGAAGPPRHLHRTFDETFEVLEGSLHLEVGDSVLVLGAGEQYVIPAGTPHRPHNPGTQPVVVDGHLPQAFAACLVQLYQLMDERGAAGPHMALQMSVIDPLCDSHIAAVPAPVMAVLKVLLAPAARLAGYRNYDPARSLHPTAG